MVIPSGVAEGVPSYMLPDDVKKYVIYFCAEFHKSNNISQIEFLFDIGHKRLSEQYFSELQWPSADVVSPLVKGDKLFLAFYKELYFRHLYAKLQPSIENRLDSYANYVALFTLFLGSYMHGPLTTPENKECNALDLPDRWLWEIVDEFLYQVIYSVTNFLSETFALG